MVLPTQNWYRLSVKVCAYARFRNGPCTWVISEMNPGQQETGDRPVARIQCKQLCTCLKGEIGRVLAKAYRGFEDVLANQKERSCRLFTLHRPGLGWAEELG